MSWQLDLFWNILSQTYIVTCFRIFHDNYIFWEHFCHNLCHDLILVFSQHLMTIRFLSEYIIRILFCCFKVFDGNYIYFILVLVGKHFCHNLILLFVSEYFMTIRFVSEYFWFCYFSQNILLHSYFVVYFGIFYDN